VALMSRGDEPDALTTFAAGRHAGAARLEEALNRLPQGVIVVGDGGTVEYVNAAAARLLAPAGMVEAGEKLPEHVGPIPLAALLRELRDDGAGSSSRLAPLEECVLQVEAFTANGSDVVVCTVADVTEQERKRHAERQFVENAAHELRTPLAAIISVVDALEGGAKDDPDTRDRFLAHLRGHSDRVARLATSLLALARAQTGQQEPRLELVALAPLVDKIVREIRTRRGVEIVKRVPATIGAVTDSNLVYHAVSNLVANAAKSTRAGEIVIEADIVGGAVELEISDSGPGMSAGDLEHAFDRFFRARDGTGEGFGLGLAIAKDALEAVGGSITLESPPGDGVHARITLPGASIIG
jgi:two-component system, OmpR family, phosphate regulon sensor histidine kinase PhoR